MLDERGKSSSEVRRAVAFVAWRLITGREGLGLYDHGDECKVSFVGMISKTEIDLRDDRGRHIVGSGGLGMYTLNPGPAEKPVTLQIRGMEFEAFDYGSSSRYRGSVDRQRLQMSVAEGGVYDFSVSDT